MNAISALIKEVPESALIPFALRSYNEKVASYEPGSRPSPDSESAMFLTLDFPVSRTTEIVECRM